MENLRRVISELRKDGANTSGSWEKLTELLDALLDRIEKLEAKPK